MYTSDIIAERIRLLAKAKDISLRALFERTGLGKNFIASSLSAGSFPKADNLARIADYLETSTDYLLGRTDDTAAPMGAAKPSLPPDEAKLLDDYRSLTEEGKKEVHKQIDLLMHKYKKDNIVSGMEETAKIS